MPLSDYLREVCESLHFRLFVHVGGGLGDACHRIKDSAYLRIAPDFKATFPNCIFGVHVEGKNPGLTAPLFGRLPGVDYVLQGIQPEGGWTWDYVDVFMRQTCDATPDYIGQEMPDADPEVIFRRVVNRVCALIRFPRVRAISMDDFFQQMGLQVDEFAWTLAEIPVDPWEQIRADGWIDEARAAGQSIIMLHAASRDASRSLYPVPKWAALIREIRSRGFAPCVFGGPDDGEPFAKELGLRGVINACREGDMGVKLALLKRAVGTICIDSGLMGLSWLHAIPTVSLVSPAGVKQPSNNTIAGYHWAVAAGEPFAVRHVIDPREPETADPVAVLEKLLAIRSTKGRRVSAAWRDQCPQ